MNYFNGRKRLRQIRNEVYKEIMKNREEILRAFIAETGLKPSECEQVLRNNGMTIEFFVRKRHK